MFNYWVESNEYFLQINLKNQYSDIDCFAIVPQMDDDYKFVCFYKLLTPNENKKINLKVLKNEALVFDKTYDGNDDLVFYETFQLQEYLPHVLEYSYINQNKIIVKFSIIINNEIKEEKNIVITNNDFKELDKNGFFVSKDIIDLQYIEERIYVTFTKSLDGVTLLIKDLNDNGLYVQQQRDYNKHEMWWFVPDNKSYKEGFEVQILRNDEIVGKKKMLLK